MTARPVPPRGYIAEFDGLRGLAVLLVLVEHFTYNEWVRSWSPGSAGVRTFFVLSGFLITGILLADRDRFDVLTAARRFFRNRALRLLPPFLLAVVLAAALGIAGMRSDWLWHVTYLSNLQIALDHRWSGAGHFWTLAVEQQFYLLWFPVVMLLPRRWLLPVVICLLFIAPAFRMLIVAGRSTFIDVLFPAQVDALALGALLALLQQMRQGGVVMTVMGKPLVMWGLIGLAVLASAPIPGVERTAFLSWVVRQSVLAAAAASVIMAVLSQQKRLGWLRIPALAGLGRISYGVYIFHYFVPPALNAYVPFVAALDEGPEKLLRLAIWVGVSILLAAASWRYVEKPAMRYKAGIVWRRGAVVKTAPIHDPKSARTGL